MKRVIILSLILLATITACGPSAEEQATLTATAQTATAAAWTLTPTITDTPTRTSTATQTATSTVTSTPTASATPTQTPTKTQTPTITPDPNRYYATDDTFSFVVPEGWEMVPSGMEYPVLYGPDVGGYFVNVLFTQEEVPFPMAIYTAFFQEDVMASLENLTQVREDFLLTDEGDGYFRWEVTNINDGITYHQVFYFFESGDWKLLAIYSRPDDRGAENDILVDEAMSTMRYQR
jgi:hypothetical protein